MEFEIVWTRRALLGVQKIKDYILEKFGKKSAKRYVQKVSQNINLISTNPFLFPVSEANPDLRRAIIKRKTIIFFRVQANLITILKVKDHRTQN
jgi:plasmid stabilization system protein ParE